MKNITSKIKKKDLIDKLKDSRMQAGYLG